MSLEHADKVICGDTARHNNNNTDRNINIKGSKAKKERTVNFYRRENDETLISGEKRRENENEAKLVRRLKHKEKEGSEVK